MGPTDLGSRRPSNHLNRAGSPPRMEPGDYHRTAFRQPPDGISKLPRILSRAHGRCRLQANAIYGRQMLGMGVESVHCPQAFEEPPGSSDHPGHGDGGCGYKRSRGLRVYAKLNRCTTESIWRTKNHSNAKPTTRAIRFAQRIVQDMTSCRNSSRSLEAKWMQRPR